jgi:hypothetical protein
MKHGTITLTHKIYDDLGSLRKTTTEYSFYVHQPHSTVMQGHEFNEADAYQSLFHEGGPKSWRQP